MELNEKELKEINELLNKALDIIEAKIPKPSKIMNSNFLDVSMQSTAILQKILLARFGESRDNLKLSLENIIKSTLNYYNSRHAQNLGFKVKIKKGLLDDI